MKFRKSLGDAIDEIEKLLYPEQTMEFVRKFRSARNELVRLEDDIICHGKGDWFRCVGCDRVYHHSDHTASPYVDEGFCYHCVPSSED